MVEDYAAYLLEEAKSGSAAMHQFRILYDERVQSYHLFFEGEEDSLFYMPEVRRISGAKKTFPYVCGGKRNVAYVRKSIVCEGYPINACLFFVDRDFDDYLGVQAHLDDHTYLTDNYSIENDIVSHESVEIILADVVRMSPADPEYSVLVSRLRENQQIFAAKIRPFMAWSVAARKEGNRPNLQNVNLNRIFELEAGAAPRKRKSAYQVYKSCTIGSESGPAFASVLIWRRQFGLCDRKKWIRGKFEAWFFQSAILKLLAETNERRVLAGSRPYRIPASLRDSRLFEILGGRISVPVSLASFLARRLGAGS